MYLIKIETLELEKFVGDQIPPYAILSHRWGAGELNFKEVMKKRVDHNKRGYRKLTDACRIAANYNVTHLWIDTCCIDKRSSAELSEAINSMFSWYEKAEVCLAYLEDVESGPNLVESFKKSVWFTRAWTLQELLAPTHVEFFDGNWDHIANKGFYAEIITSITGIPQRALTKESELSGFEIAKRMSWASNRKALKTEDIAYSLMGIFDINMPLLYGEGTKAFVRLLEEIIRRANELSFLRWGLNTRSHQLLAKSPEDFRDARLSQSYHGTARGPPFSLTNFGLKIETTLYRKGLNEYGMKISQDGSTAFVLFLRKHIRPDTFYRTGIGRRLNPQTPRWVKAKKITVLLYTQEIAMTKDIKWSEQVLDAQHGFYVRMKERLPIEFDISKGCTWYRSGNSYGNPDPICKFSNPHLQIFGRMKYHLQGSSSFFIELFFSFDSIPCALFRKDTTLSASALQAISEWEPTERSRTSKYTDLQWHSRKIEKHLERMSGNMWRCWGDTLVDNHYRLPEDLFYPDPQLWVRFIPPGHVPNQTRLWGFQISRVDPLGTHYAQAVPPESYIPSYMFQ